MGLWLIAALLLAYSGMLGLCLGLERHYKQLWQRPLSKGLQRGLRGSGWVLLAASLACCVKAWGWAMGATGWFGLISMAGLALALMLPYALRFSVLVPVVGWPLWGVMALV